MVKSRKRVKKKISSKRKKETTRATQVQCATIPDAKFKSIMNKILEEHRDVFERLAKK